MLDQRGLIARADLETALSAWRVAEAAYDDSRDEARNRQGLLAQRRSELDISRQQLTDTTLLAPIDAPRTTLVTPNGWLEFHASISLIEKRDSRMVIGGVNDVAHLEAGVVTEVGPA